MRCGCSAAVLAPVQVNSGGSGQIDLEYTIRMHGMSSLTWERVRIDGREPRSRHWCRRTTPWSPPAGLVAALGRLVLRGELDTLVVDDVHDLVACPPMLV